MPKDVPVVTGYYRYTDIWFEWYASALSSINPLFLYRALIRYGT